MLLFRFQRIIYDDQSHDVDRKICENKKKSCDTKFPLFLALMTLSILFHFKLILAVEIYSTYKARSSTEKNKCNNVKNIDDFPTVCISFPWCSWITSFRMLSQKKIKNYKWKQGFIVTHCNTYVLMLISVKCTVIHWWREKDVEQK